MNELIDKALNGNKEAYVSAINEILSDLFKIANARLDNIEDINDAINETILKSYKNLKKLEHKEYFKTWIIKILINECNIIYKNNNRQLSIVKKILKNKDYRFYENTTSKVDSKLDFESLLAKLNYDEKIVVILYYNNKYTTSEIADILGENVNTIKTRLLRAKAKIKNDCKGEMKL